MATVYLVIDGSYSDYHVEGVFSSRAKAQEFIDKALAASRKHVDNYLYTGISDDPTIDERTLDQLLEKEVYTRHNIGIMVDTGEVKERSVSGPHFDVPHSKVYVSEKVPAYKHRDIVRAESHKSAKHALKLAVEKRQELQRAAGQRS